MDHPERIDSIIDGAMAEILGPAGNEFYADLVRQTQATREAIERDVRAMEPQFFCEAVGELAMYHMPPEELDLAARMQTSRRVQVEIGRRISAEEAAFRERLQTLYAWAQSQNEPR